MKRGSGEPVVQAGVLRLLWDQVGRGGVGTHRCGIIYTVKSEEGGRFEDAIVKISSGVFVVQREDLALYKIRLFPARCWPAAAHHLILARRLLSTIRVVPHVGNRTIFASSQTRKPPRPPKCSLSAV